MRPYIFAVVIGVTIGLACAALAADIRLSTITANAGGAHICTGTLRPKAKYAIQCNERAFVHASTGTANIADGGAGSDPATSADVLVPPFGLFDIETVKENTRICIIASDAGTVSCNVFLHRNAQE